MKWPKQQAVIAAGTEIIAGALLVVGLATPLSCIAVIALMTVAIVTVHARVGYFIFLPNGGWEYCASIVAVATAIAITGPIGLMCALCHLTLCWRPQTNNPSA